MNKSLLTLDFSGLDEPTLSRLLEQHGIPLTPHEAVRLQNEILGRPPTLTESILFGIEGSEHCSYKSRRKAQEEIEKIHGPLFHRKDIGTRPLLDARIAMMKDLRGLSLE